MDSSAETSLSAEAQAKAARKFRNVQIAGAIFSAFIFKVFGANATIPAIAGGLTLWVLQKRIRPREPAYVGAISLLVAQVCWMIAGALMFDAPIDQKIEIGIYLVAIAWLFWRPGLVAVLLLTALWGITILDMGDGPGRGREVDAAGDGSASALAPEGRDGPVGMDRIPGATDAPWKAGGVTELVPEGLRSLHWRGALDAFHIFVCHRLQRSRSTVNSTFANLMRYRYPRLNRRGTRQRLS